MRNSLFCLLLLIFCSSATASYAQLSKEQIKERKELRKTTAKELNLKATKTARKEASRLKKEGWKIAAGALPLEIQLDKSYQMQLEYDEDLFPRYLISEGMSISGSYDAAKIQAIEVARVNLAGQIQTEVTALIENSISTTKLEADEAQTLAKTVNNSKTLISQSLGRILPVVEIYRDLENKNKEVLVRISYDSKKAKAVVKKVLRAGLSEGEDTNLVDKLDGMGW